MLNRPLDSVKGRKHQDPELCAIKMVNTWSLKGITPDLWTPKEHATLRRGMEVHGLFDNDSLQKVCKFRRYKGSSSLLIMSAEQLLPHRPVLGVHTQRLEMIRSCPELQRLKLVSEAKEANKMEGIGNIAFTWIQRKKFMETMMQGRVLSLAIAAVCCTFPRRVPKDSLADYLTSITDRLAEVPLLCFMDPGLSALHRPGCASMPYL